MNDWAPRGTCTCKDCGSAVRVHGDDDGDRDYVWYCTNTHCLNSLGSPRYDTEDEPEWCTLDTEAT